MIQFQCSQCGKKLKAPVGLGGQGVKCTLCGHMETVPGKSEAQASKSISPEAGAPRQFKPKTKSSQSALWWIVGVGATVCLLVAAAVAYVVVQRASAVPKFKAEFESMAEVEFYRRAHGQLEQTRKRMSVMADAFKAKNSSAGDFSQEQRRLNESINSYTENSDSLMQEAAALLAQGKDLHAKSLLVETGKKMQALIVEIDNEVAQFNKKANK